jgi:hypothetical protein
MLKNLTLSVMATPDQDSNSHEFPLILLSGSGSVLKPIRNTALKVHKIEIFFGFDFEICIISLLVM